MRRAARQLRFAVLRQLSTFTAIGTTHGLVAIFDQDQELRMVIGTAQTGTPNRIGAGGPCDALDAHVASCSLLAPGSGAEYGPVTCLDVSADQTRLVIGHRQGHIVFCELPRGRLLKTLVAGERHDKGLAIVSVTFLQGSVNAVLAVDSKVRAPAARPPPAYAWFSA